jgi:anti-anti-sigma factor
LHPSGATIDASSKGTIATKNVDIRGAGNPPIILTGEFDLRRHAELDALFDDVKDAPCVVVDCSAVTFLTASALGRFVRLKNSLPTKTPVRLYGVRPQIYELFALTQLTSLFEIYDYHA